VTTVSVISGLVATVVAAIALRYNAMSFDRLKKAEDLRERTEELRTLEGIYRDIARNLKDFRLLEAESPKVGEEENTRQRKLEVMLSETFADIN